ncbi:hypothetical protein ACET3Z_017997 [Daucus carota]
MAANSSSPGTSVNREVKTCHQCRQHRSSATACKGQRKRKPCTLLYCQKCLLNRYGEKAEEAEASEVWSCPKCRDICNCSICRAKRGHLPTGNLSHKAKAAGYSSVSELLHAKGPENFGLVKNANETGASLKRRRASKKLVKQPRMLMLKMVKFISLSSLIGNLILKLHLSADLSPVLLCDVSFADISSKIAVPDRPKNSDENGKEFVGVAENYAAGKKMFTDQPFLDSPENGKAMEEETERANQQVDEEADKKKPDNLVALGNKVDKLSTMITGIDKRIETSYHLLCSSTRSYRESESPATILQFLHGNADSHFEEKNVDQIKCGKNSWLFALKIYLSESPNAKDLLPIIGLDSETGGYINTLYFSMKRIRDWINNQESKFAQKAKQAKKKVLAAKDKVKSLKQKLADELAKAITAKDGSSLSISEHDEIVSQIKCEAAQAHKEMLESMNMAPKGWKIFYPGQLS